MADQPPETNANGSQEPSVRITLSTIYSEVVGLRTEVGGMRSDLRTVLATDADHETRIRAVEANQASYVTKAQAAWWTGALIALVAACAAVLSLLIK